MEKVKMTFTYTRDEYVKAVRQYLVANKTIRKLDLVLLAVFLPLSIFYLLYSSYSTTGIVLIVLVLVVAALGCTLYFYTPARNFDKTPKYQEEYMLEFSEDGIWFKTASVDSRLKWDVYARVLESGDFYFLVQINKMYTVIPKRAFADGDDMRAFETLVKARLSGTKQIA